MNATSEYVRQELRAVVGARTGGRPGSQGQNQHQQTQQQQQQQMAMSPMQTNSMGLGQMNPMGITNLNTGQMGGMMQQSLMQSQSELDALGLSFDTHGMFLIIFISIIRNHYFFIFNIFCILLYFICYYIWHT